ncbi:MAG TPA: ABC transporter substrate-binding protein [Candidatus Binatia bacterium]|nr:ABC transporter substrate-binding protein [Candidatus Binatia bacterium]
MKRSRIWLSVAASAVLALAGCGAPGGDGGDGGEADVVQLQLQWTPQAQFAGYFAAVEQGYYADEGLDVEILDGGPDVIPQAVGCAADGPAFTISWVPKVLEAREQDCDLVDIAQVFQRSGTLSVAWADSGITSPADYAGKRVGVWDFGNEFEVTAGARAVGLEEGTDYTKVIQAFDMSALLNDEVDVAEAMIYNEYAQVLETENPDTGELYQPEDLTVIDYNEVGTAMLQDAIFARASWLAEEGNEDVATRFLRASFRGWIYCRENPDDCVEYTTNAGSALGAGHQAWMMNEINPLIWPSPGGIGVMDADLWQQTVDISVESGIISEPPPDGAYRTDLAEAALEGIEDATGDGFTKGSVEVTPGGE